MKFLTSRINSLLAPRPLKNFDFIVILVHYLLLLGHRRTEDPLLQMASKEHEVKMKVLILEEWKLNNDCFRAGYVLTSSYRSYLGDLQLDGFIE